MRPINAAANSFWDDSKDGYVYAAKKARDPPSHRARQMLQIKVHSSRRSSRSMFESLWWMRGGTETRVRWEREGGRLGVSYHRKASSLRRHSIRYRNSFGWTIPTRVSIVMVVTVR